MHMPSHVLRAVPCMILFQMVLQSRERTDCLQGHVAKKPLFTDHNPEGVDNP